MKRILYLSIIAAVALFAGCVKEEPTPGVVLDPVKNLQASAGDQIVILSWDTVPDGASPVPYDYLVVFHDPSNVKHMLYTDGENVCELKELVNGFDYTFSVLAKYSEGLSAAQTIIATPVLSKFPLENVSASDGDRQVTIRWKANPTALRYKISWSGDGVAPGRADAPAGSSEYIVGNLENDVEYTFKVSGVYEAGQGAATTVKSMPYALIPVETFTAKPGDQTVDLSWTKPSDNLVGYVLEYADKTEELAADVSNKNVTGLVNGTEYTFTIIAKYPRSNSSETSLKATPVEIAPVIPIPETLAGKPVTLEFDSSRYPSATLIKWNVGGKTLEGAKVQTIIDADYSVMNNKVQDVVITVSATLNGTVRSWNYGVKVKPYCLLMIPDKFGEGQTYNGFKGSCPVFSPDGKTMYDITFNKKTVLYAFNVETGEIKWTFAPDVDCPSYNPITVNPITGDIYVPTQTVGKFFAVTSAGKLKWTFTGLGSCQSAGPAVSKDGATVYASDALGKVAAINASNGEQIWMTTITASKKCGGVLVNGNEIVATQNNTTKSVNFINASDGSIISSINLTKAPSDITGLTTSSDKQFVYIGCAGGYVAKVDIVNHTLVKEVQVAGNNLWEGCVSPKDGSVFFGGKDSKVYCLDSNDLSVKWSYTYLSDANNAFNYSHPCVDEDGNFYISAGQVKNTQMIFSPEGNILRQWSFGTDNQKTMGGVNLLNGVMYCAYIGAAGDSGALVGFHVGGKPASGWSCHGGDICGSSCIR